MNRIQLQQLAEQRVTDSEALLNVGQWSGAYYLAGYAVECGLKACIAKLTQEFDFPDKDLAQRAYTHKIEKLVEVARLQLPRNAAVDADAIFGDHWLLVKDWDEEARYRLSTELQARKLYGAVTDLTHGVLPWIRGHW